MMQKYLVIDNKCDVIERFSSLGEAYDVSVDWIMEYIDSETGTWMDVPEIEVWEIRAVVKANKIIRPPEIPDNSYDSSGEYWEVGVHEKIDYDLEEIQDLKEVQKELNHG